MVAAQEARLFHAGGLARVGPRSARRADELPALRVRGGVQRTCVVGDSGVRRAWLIEPAEPDGFFLQLQGQFGTFLYADPDDNTVAGQAFATGTGSTTSFTMMRSLGGFLEPVGWVTAIANVYLNGVVQSSSGYSLTAPNALVFTSAPASGATVSADFSYAFNCRFLDDQMDFEEFMSSLWRLESMKFRSVKP
jgi:hypothetical protein